MQTKPTHLKTILSLLTAAKIKKGVRATSGLIFALLFSAIVLSGNISAQTKEPTSLRGGQRLTGLSRRGNMIRFRKLSKRRGRPREQTRPKPLDRPQS